MIKDKSFSAGLDRIATCYFFKPLIDRTFEIMEKHGLLPEKPEEIDDAK